MNNTTLEEIQAKQATATEAQEHATAAQQAVNKLIELYKTTRRRVVKLLAADIELKEGERYGGAILNDDGTISHHVILLPDEHEGAEWEEAKAWAAELGGSLPDGREQSLLFANLKSCFGAFAYWSSEVYNERSAWYQYFSSGSQRHDAKSAGLRARVVRRVFP